MTEIERRPSADLARQIQDKLATARSGWFGTLDPTARRVVTAALAGLALLAIVWALSGEERRQKYVTETVKRGDLTVVITATGSVEPTNKVDVSSELSGMVKKVLVDYNTPVKVGDVLAELDTDKLKATVESARAKLAAAKARIADAKATLIEKEREFVRKRELEARAVTSTHDLEIAQAAFDRAVAGVATAEADVAVAEADLKLKETDLAKACICSPINGVVLERNVDPGQTVASSFQAPVLFSIAEDLKKMEIRVDVDEADVGKVSVGQRASFTVDAYPDRKFPAEIRAVRYASEVVQGVVTYKAILAIDNSDLLLRPGMTATAEIVVDHVRGALLIPNGALRFMPSVQDDSDQDVGFLRRIMPGPPPFRPPSKHEEGGSQRTIWLLRDESPLSVSVEIGATDGKITEIKQGELAEGENVIVSAMASSSS